MQHPSGISIHSRERNHAPRPGRACHSRSDSAEGQASSTSTGLRPPSSISHGLMNWHRPTPPHSTSTRRAPVSSSSSRN